MGISNIKYFPSNTIVPSLKLVIRLKLYRDPAMPSRDPSSADVEPPAKATLVSPVNCLQR